MKNRLHILVLAFIMVMSVFFVTACGKEDIEFDVTSMEVFTNSAQTEFGVTEEFSSENLRVFEKYSNGYLKEINADKYTVTTNFDNTVIGDYTVTISHKQKPALNSTYVAKVRFNNYNRNLIFNTLLNAIAQSKSYYELYAYENYYVEDTLTGAYTYLSGFDYSLTDRVFCFAGADFFGPDFNYYYTCRDISEYLELKNTLSSDPLSIFELSETNPLVMTWNDVLEMYEYIYDELFGSTPPAFTESELNEKLEEYFNSIGSLDALINDEANEENFAGMLLKDDEGNSFFGYIDIFYNLTSAGSFTSTYNADTNEITITKTEVDGEEINTLFFVFDASTFLIKQMTFIGELETASQYYFFNIIPQ